MTSAEAMLSTLHTNLPAPAREALARAVAACTSCVETCTMCATACLAEPNVADLRECIATDMDCADICGVTGRVLGRAGGADPEMTRALLEACIVACRVCAEDCESHAEHHEHCRICAEACRTCEDACRDLLAQLS